MKCPGSARPPRPPAGAAPTLVRPTGSRRLSDARTRIVVREDLPVRAPRERHPERARLTEADAVSPAAPVEREDALAVGARPDDDAEETLRESEREADLEARQRERPLRRRDDD